MPLKKSADGVPALEPKQIMHDIQQASATAVGTVESVIEAATSVAVAELDSAARGSLTAPATAAPGTAPSTTKAIAAFQMARMPEAPVELKMNVGKVMKTAEDMMTFGQANLEAFTRSGQIWAAGVQDLGKQVAATAQAQMQQTVETMKAMAGIRSIKDALDLQSNLARASMEKVVAETGKLTDASMKLAEQTMAPLAARMTVAMEKLGRPV